VHLLESLRFVHVIFAALSRLNLNHVLVGRLVDLCVKTGYFVVFKAAFAFDIVDESNHGLVANRLEMNLAL
jgi:hypothetical protein